MDTTDPATRTHLAPTSCYVCGYPEDQHQNTGHAFWSNAQAREDFAKEPQGNTNPEARYIDQYRPY